MPRHFSWPAAVLLAVLAAGTTAGATAGPGQPAQDPPIYLVDTTQDVPVQPEHCVPPALCPLRSALELANTTGGVVTATLCDNPGDPGCLSTADPGFEASTGKWVINIDPALAAFIVAGEGVQLDFARTVAGWSGPRDNVVAIDAGTELGQALTVEGQQGVVTGLDIRGRFSTAALEVRIGATGNRVGPGVVIAGTAGPAAFRIRDTVTRQNEIRGNWCGVDASLESDPVEGHCVLVDRGANANTVADNWLAGASGSGIVLEGQGTTGNTIQANRVGPPEGATGPQVGILLTTGAGPNLVKDNAVWGAAEAGIRLSDVFDVVLEGNDVGARDGTPAGNGGWGIELRDFSKGSVIRGNTARYNGSGGILIAGGQSTENTVTRNAVTANEGVGIRVSGGANGRIEPPTLSNVAERRIAGLACNRCVLEFYSDDGDEAKTFEGEVTAASIGTFIFDKPEGFTGSFVTAIQAQGRNSSGQAASKPVPGRVTPTPTAVATVAPEGSVVFLPWAGMRASLGGT